MTIARGVRESSAVLDFIKGASFIAESSDQGFFGDTTEFRCHLYELSFPEGQDPLLKGAAPAARYSVVNEVRYSTESGAGSRQSMGDKKPQVTHETLDGHWKLDPDDASLLTGEFGGRYVRDFVLSVPKRTVTLMAENGDTLKEPRVFHLRGYSSCGVEPAAEALVEAWEKGSDNKRQLPSSSLALLKIQDRRKLKKFDEQRKEL